MRARVVPAAVDHIAPVAAAMRQADRDEVWATSHSTPERALARGVANSTRVWVGLVDGEPACLFGVAPRSIVLGEGTPWLLGTEATVRYQRAFLAASRVCVDAMLAVYPRLVNYVDDRNEASKRWLLWLGFTLDEPAPYGVDGLMFRRFTMEVS